MNAKTLDADFYRPRPDLSPKPATQRTRLSHFFRLYLLADADSEKAKAADANTDSSTTCAGDHRLLSTGRNFARLL